MIREFDITYITKEYLINNKWEIIAYNPPGSQGTFTIPNPNKDSYYRGQTGSESPDIVALSSENDLTIILIVESKPDYNKEDISKMKNMFLNLEREKLFIEIVLRQCEANNISFNLNKYKIIYAKAHAGEKHLRNDMITYHVTSKNVDWNPDNFRANDEISQYLSVEEFNPF